MTLEDKVELSRLRQVAYAAGDLLRKLDEIHQDSRYIGVWTHFHVHGGRYTGPQYDTQLEKLRELLTEAGIEYTAIFGAHACPA